MVLGSKSRPWNLKYESPKYKNGRRSARIVILCRNDHHSTRELLVDSAQLARSAVAATPQHYRSRGPATGRGAAYEMLTPRLMPKPEAEAKTSANAETAKERPPNLLRRLRRGPSVLRGGRWPRRRRRPCRRGPSRRGRRPRGRRK